MLRRHKEQGEINLRLILAGRLSQLRSVFLCFVQASKHFQDAALNLKLPFLHVEILSGLLLPKKGQVFIFLRVESYKSGLWEITALLVGALMDTKKAHCDVAKDKRNPNREGRKKTENKRMEAVQYCGEPGPRDKCRSLGRGTVLWSSSQQHPFSQETSEVCCFQASDLCSHFRGLKWLDFPEDPFMFTLRFQVQGNSTVSVSPLQSICVVYENELSEER